MAVTSVASEVAEFGVDPDPVTGQASGPARRLTQDGRMKQVRSPGGDPGALYFRDFVPGGKSTSEGFALDPATGQQRR